MNSRTLPSIAAALLAAGTLGCASFEGDTSGNKAATTAAAGPQSEGQPAMPLPPGWTEADMQACMAAGVPGDQHRVLAEAAGTWHGTSMMWMAPGMEPSKSECTSTITMLMDGRFLKNETKGDMPGMGPFEGYGISAFDNVAQQFVASWIDNFSTGMMTGTGELSPDGKTLTWHFTYNCPIRKGPAKMREIQRMTGADTMELEMYGADPKSGQEYKMMHISYTRKK